MERNSDPQQRVEIYKDNLGTRKYGHNDTRKRVFPGRNRFQFLSRTGNLDEPRDMIYYFPPSGSKPRMVDLSLLKILWAGRLPGALAGNI
jgi:hypothetical protein